MNWTPETRLGYNPKIHVIHDMQHPGKKTGEYASMTSERLSGTLRRYLTKAVESACHACRIQAGISLCWGKGRPGIGKDQKIIRHCTGYAYDLTGFTGEDKQPKYDLCLLCA